MIHPILFKPESKNTKTKKGVSPPPPPLSPDTDNGVSSSTVWRILGPHKAKTRCSCTGQRWRRDALNWSMKERAAATHRQWKPPNLFVCLFVLLFAAGWVDREEKKEGIVKLGFESARERREAGRAPLRVWLFQKADALCTHKQ